MATPKPQIRSLFATPVCVHFLPVAQEANAELRPLVLEKMQMNGNGPSRGQGWRSQNDLEDWGGAQAKTLFRVVRELADGATATRAGGRVTLDWKITACAAVRQKGEFQEMRPRTGAVWSGIYFADDGYDRSDDEALGGECELGDPRGALPAMVAPTLAFRIPGGQTAGQSELIRPATGMIILHPSWQPRGERLFEGPAQRVAIEFDLAPPG
ncbi:MAG TPA: hypothetical protein VHW02_08570 [Rhizomicrobium sp.]|jgi:hypothetical protein|nr:hypothetical protein [Rhizomicrobium sp.]